MPLSQHPISGSPVPPGTTERGVRGHWVSCGTALVLVVLLHGANVSPAGCAGTATRHLGLSASTMSVDCCGEIASPPWAAGVSRTLDARACCCTPGGPCSVTRAVEGSEGVPLKEASRYGASQSLNRTADPIPGSPGQGSTRTALIQAPDGQLLLRIGVLRI